MVATYNPDIPQSNENLSTSQGEMLDNFGQLNDQFGVDHTAFNTGSGNGDGFHKKVTYNVPQGSNPGASGNQSVLYTKIISALPQLFFQNSSLVTQLTGLTGTFSANGGVDFPQGFGLRWGSIAIAATPQVVVYTTAFPTATFIALTQLATSRSIAPAYYVSATSTTGFTLTFNTGGFVGTTFYYLAIGN